MVKRHPAAYGGTESSCAVVDLYPKYISQETYKMLNF